MIRALLVCSLSCATLAACSDQAPAPAPLDSPSPATITTPLPEPIVETVQSPPSSTQAGLPNASNVFPDEDSCHKAGYSIKQCGDAWSVSNAMSHAGSVVYPSLNDCKRYFRACEQKDGAKGFIPSMGGFSLGSEAPGVDRTPSASAPQWFTPVYLDIQGRWVYLSQDNNDQTVATPVPSLPLKAPDATSAPAFHASSSSPEKSSASP